MFVCACVWQQGVAAWHQASRFTCSMQVDGRMLPLPLPYFMSPVCGAACVIDMLTVNVIGRQVGGQYDSGGTLHLTDVVPCPAEVVKRSHRPAPALTGATHVAGKRVKF